MATDFWSSTHYKRWIVDRVTIQHARVNDILYVPDAEYLDFLSIYFANAIAKLGKRLHFRQRVIATATVFFRRFYLKNSYCETDPFLVISACCYVAAKAEESPIHIKSVINESRSLFSQESYGQRIFTSEVSKIAEMEFYLIGDLECDLVVFHPYRTLVALCRSCPEEKDPFAGKYLGFFGLEAGELGIGIGGDEGPRYWGTGDGYLELSEGALQTAWFIINDTYRSDICILHEPHLLAIAAIYLALVLHPQTCEALEARLREAPPTAQQQRRPSQSSKRNAARDPIAFLAGLNVSFPRVSTIVQEIVSMYSRWDRYKEDESPSVQLSDPLSAPASVGQKVTPRILSNLLVRMQEARFLYLARHPTTVVRPAIVNKILGRATSKR
ncbi:C/H/G cyclin [Fistulina hepatica ATCC 64428]|uniref:C/H/G cyclin n=1 Tax=Fistulina hepatica ATCC 64428 TaxID=1128425 RepID=A0A0D7A0P1_9AGAR|nr:C/H/G cyclin [Fistulina hepatica ATCC 64428]KIY43325.1 C/H/G cyclin [Fistulina hepatica ATCC 64428]